MPAPRPRRARRPRRTPVTDITAPRLAPTEAEVQAITMFWAAGAYLGTESNLQQTIVSTLRVVAPDVRVAAVPNGGYRCRKTAGVLKAEGLSSGFPDLQVFDEAVTVRLEVKIAPRGQWRSAVKPEQWDWLCWMHRNGHPVHVVNSVEGVMAALWRHTRKARYEAMADAYHRGLSNP